MNVSRKRKVAVIIPYFQRQPGILAECVRSILAQEGSFDLRIVITDDESPAPACEELRSLSIEPETIHLTRQKNAGPGAARNTALDNIPPDTDYVAMMDSDDRWEPGFLAVALSALDQGYDLFFSNTHRFGQQKSRFEWNAEDNLSLVPDEHTLIDSEHIVYSFVGDFFDYAIRRSNILSSSAMVFRRTRSTSKLRFDTDLYNGQDRLFKLELSMLVERVAFTSQVLCSEGEGVNIFDSAGWGSSRSLSFAASYIQLSKAILRRLPLDSAQERHVRAHLASCRQSFVAGLLHRLIRMQSIDRAVLVRTLRNDPATFALLLPNTFKACIEKFLANRT